MFFYSRLAPWVKQCGRYWEMKGNIDIELTISYDSIVRIASYRTILFETVKVKLCVNHTGTRGREKDRFKFKRFDCFFFAIIIVVVVVFVNFIILFCVCVWVVCALYYVEWMCMLRNLYEFYTILFDWKLSPEDIVLIVTEWNWKWNPFETDKCNESEQVYYLFRPIRRFFSFSRFLFLFWCAFVRGPFLFPFLFLNK